MISRKQCSFLHHKLYTCPEQLYLSHSKGENNPNVHPYNGILLKNKKLLIQVTAWMNLKKHHANWKKPDLNGLWFHLNRVREKNCKTIKEVAIKDMGVKWGADEQGVQRKFWEINCSMVVTQLNTFTKTVLCVNWVYYKILLQYRWIF